MHRILLASPAEKGRQGMAREIAENGWFCAEASGAEELRRLAAEEFALIVLDDALPGVSDGTLVQFLLDETSSLLILLAKADWPPEKMAGWEEQGVLFLMKPVGKSMFCHTIRLALAAKRRILGIKTENAKLYHKIEEIRLVDRAKCVLIQYLGLTEPQAHRYIEKQAMDRRMTREEVAGSILKTYET